MEIKNLFIKKPRINFKGFLLFATVLLFAQSSFAQTDCEKLFFKAMQEVQTHVEKKGLSAKQAEAYTLKKNKEIKANNPNCFPGEQVAEAKMDKPAKKAGSLKIDSQNLKDEEIQEIDAKYTKAAATCKEELKKDLQNLSKEEASQMLHNCALDKMVSGM